MQQFPPGFQGSALAGFNAAAANFGLFRPQFSVPGQAAAGFSGSSSGTQVRVNE